MCYYVLQLFLPEKPDLSHNLRERTHNRSLTTKTIDLTERDFLIRMLYKDCYYSHCLYFTVLTFTVKLRRGVYTI